MHVQVAPSTSAPDERGGVSFISGTRPTGWYEVTVRSPPRAARPLHAMVTAFNELLELIDRNGT